jgi:hypothetical protein
MSSEPNETEQTGERKSEPGKGLEQIAVRVDEQTAEQVRLCAAVAHLPTGRVAGILIWRALRCPACSAPMRKPKPR